MSQSLLLHTERVLLKNILRLVVAMGSDASFSMELKEMTVLVDEAKRAWEVDGSVNYEF